jgi:hypothetical protein
MRAVAGEIISVAVGLLILWWIGKLALGVIFAGAGVLAIVLTAKLVL